MLGVANTLITIIVVSNSQIDRTAIYVIGTKANNKSHKILIIIIYFSCNSSSPYPLSFSVTIQYGLRTIDNKALTKVSNKMLEVMQLHYNSRLGHL